MSISLIGLTSSPAFFITDMTRNAKTLVGIPIKSVRMQFTSRLLTNRGERGEIIIDGRVIEPSEIVVTTFCTSITELEEVNRLLRNVESIFQITSRGLEFPGYMVQSNQQEQSAEHLSTSPVEIRFKRVMVPAKELPICAQAGDAATTFGGIVNAYKQDAVKSLEKIQNTLSFGE